MQAGRVGLVLAGVVLGALLTLVTLRYVPTPRGTAFEGRFAVHVDTVASVERPADDVLDAAQHVSPRPPPAAPVSSTRASELDAEQPLQKPFCDVDRTRRALRALGVDWAALRRSVLYPASGLRLEQKLADAIERQRVLRVGYIGGSVSTDRSVGDQHYAEVFVSWLRNVTGVQHELRAGAMPATGSTFFRFCSQMRVGMDVDIVLVEFGVNDVYNLSLRSEEEVIHTIHNWPSRPAVVLLNFIRLPSGYVSSQESLQMLAVLYDLPAISHKNMLWSWILEAPIRDNGRVAGVTATVNDMDIKSAVERLNNRPGASAPGFLQRDLVHPTAVGHAQLGWAFVHYIQTHILECASAFTRDRLGLRRARAADGSSIAELHQPPGGELRAPPFRLHKLLADMAVNDTLFFWDHMAALHPQDAYRAPPQPGSPLPQPICLSVQVNETLPTYLRAKQADDGWSLFTVITRKSSGGPRLASADSSAGVKGTGAAVDKPLVSDVEAVDNAVVNRFARQDHAQNKTYWRGTVPAAKISFCLDVDSHAQVPLVVNLYYLRAPYNVGSRAECWLRDADAPDGKTAVIVVSVAPNNFATGSTATIGQATRAGGRVCVTCRVLPSVGPPGTPVDFRIMGILAGQ